MQSRFCRKVLPEQMCMLFDYEKGQSGGSFKQLLAVVNPSQTAGNCTLRTVTCVGVEASNPSPGAFHQGSANDFILSFKAFLSFGSPETVLASPAGTCRVLPEPAGHWDLSRQASRLALAVCDALRHHRMYIILLANFIEMSVLRIRCNDHRSSRGIWRFR